MRARRPTTPPMAPAIAPTGTLLFDELLVVLLSSVIVPFSVFVPVVYLLVVAVVVTVVGTVTVPGLSVVLLVAA